LRRFARNYDQEVPMNPDKLQQAIELYDCFTHEGMDRRDFFARMTMLAGSAAAATSLAASIAASPAAAAIVPEGDRRLTTRTMTFDRPAGYKAYVAEPRSRSLKATVLVIHENRGLTGHIKDVARRLGLEGFRAIAPDFLSLSGGTPTDENAARDAISKLDLAKVTADAVTMLGDLAKSSRGGKVGTVGFCWGGAFVDRLAVAAGAKLDAGVSYYGPAPNPSEAAKVQAPLMIHLAGLDTRVAETAWPWITALRQAGKKVTYFNYEGTNHAFNTATSAERYHKDAADLAWKRTIRFFRQNLA
jgi:carboxymethylenebutenolidase